MTNESIECPLCMEPMDFDDVDFYPCPCRYQICRFCWDKIINEENGLCPACRKAYNSENPASYKPRTEEEIKNKIKHSKKVCIKKVKPVPEGKEYLSEYRVLQKNLIFVVGLPMRMAEEVELLKGLEYFGRCGKVYKIVINQNQTFPGPQGTPCLSAYVTYHRNEDALKTLVDLKKLEIDGRAVKLSLGTTKYCSQFLRNRRCTKQDCMYLHEMGDHAASFTKEDMANGKHTEYENQLIQEFFDNQKLSTLSPSPTAHNGTSVPLTSIEPEKTLQRKTSLSGSQMTPCVSCPLTVSSSVTSVNKCQRTGYSASQITPIGTDPNDASKIYSVSSSSSSSENCHSVKNSLNKITMSSITPLENQSSLLTNVDSLDGIVLPDSPTQSFIQVHNSSDNQATQQSLLDSFYYLNSQVTGNNNSHSYDQTIAQQVNNNGLGNYYSNDPTSDLNRSFGNNNRDNNNSIEHKFKDNADIDFDPINISRMGLEELIANENRQKMTSYLPPIYAPQQTRTVLRPSAHEYMTNNDFYSNSNGNNTNLSHRMSVGQSFLHDKQSLSQQLPPSKNSLPVTVAPISSGYPSPPPGFEVNHSCIGEPPSNEIMNIIMNTGADMYNRYQNQHSSSEIPLSMNHHSSSYSNQYSIPSGHSYHNDYSGGYSNGSMIGSGSGTVNGAGYSDISSQSHPWKTATQSIYCDGNGPSDGQSHQGIRSSAAAAAVAAYNRSHSMNDNNIGIRNSEWNGFASYNNNTNDSHMSNYPFY